MARSALSDNSSSSADNGSWHESAGEPGWSWKGDTSSDEVVGHMFAYPLVHDLLEEKKEEEEEGDLRHSVQALVDTIVGKVLL